jgi:hypothetical protein
LYSAAPHRRAADHFAGPDWRSDDRPDDRSYDGSDDGPDDRSHRHPDRHPERGSFADRSFFHP